MDKWEELHKYCWTKIYQAQRLCPTLDKAREGQLWTECAYMMKHYHDILLKMKALEDEEKNG